MPETAPFIVYASQDDSFQMDHNKCADPLPTEGGAAQQYALYFANQTRDLAMELAKLGGRAVYSSGCYNHAVSETETFFTEKVRGVSMAEALKTFIKAQTSAVANAWIEDCQGWKCGASCR